MAVGVAFHVDFDSVAFYVDSERDVLYPRDVAHTEFYLIPEKLITIAHVQCCHEDRNPIHY